MSTDAPPPGYLAKPPCEVMQMPVPPLKVKGWEITAWCGTDEGIYLRLTKGKRDPKTWWARVPDPGQDRDGT